MTKRLQHLISMGLVLLVLLGSVGMAKGPAAQPDNSGGASTRGFIFNR